MVKLKFDGGDSVRVDVLGSLDIDGKRYAYLFDEESRQIYIYRYKKKRKKYILTEITDREEFDRACDAFDRKVGAKK